jgi:PAS domain S-box-containing protein
MRLVGLVLLAVVPLLAMVLITASFRRRAATAAAERQAVQLAQLAAAGQVRLFEGARQLLSTLAQVPGIGNGSTPANDALLSRLVAQHRFYLNLGVVRPEGTVICSAVPASAAVNCADQPWFREALASGQFGVGGYQTERVTGRPSLGFGYAVLDVSNMVQAVVNASLDLAHLSYQFGELDLPLAARLALVDRQGVVLAASAGAREDVGQTIPEFALLRSTGLARMTRSARAADRNGTPCIYAFAPVSVGRGGRDAWVSVCIPMTTVLAEANRQLQQDLAGWGFVAVLALVAAWFGSEVFVLRRVRALAWSARRMRDGELGARTGLPHGRDELGQLATAFDQMATALEQRDAERHRAADALRRHRDELELRVRERATELTQERNLLHGLLNSLPDYIYVKDRDGRYLIDNAMHRALLGVHLSADVVGRTAADFFPPELAAQFQADDQAVLNTGVPIYNRREQVVDAAGNRITIVTTKVPLRGEDGQIIGLVGVGRAVADVSKPDAAN